MNVNKVIRVIKTGKTDSEIIELNEEIANFESEDEVLVRVMSCGVCFRDIIDKEGGNPYINIPICLGHEISGVIVKVGKNVIHWKEGERVVNRHNAPCFHCSYCNEGEHQRCISNPTYIYGLTHNGGYQQYVCLHQNSLIKLPNEISFDEACFLFCTAGVALRALRKAKFREGKKVLITGGSGGVGVHAIQLVKAMGGQVYSITSNESKKQYLLEYGADHVMVCESSSFHEQFIREYGMMDIVLELVGQPTFHSALKCLNLLGSIVIVGNITTSPISMNPGLLILKELSVIGSSSASLKDMTEVFDLVIAKKLKPIIYKSLPLSVENVNYAHSLLKSKNVIGRIVLIPTFPSSL